jgi:hypothetical protein
MKLIKKADIILIVLIVIAVLSFVLFNYFSGENLTAVVRVKGEIIEKVNLEKQKEPLKIVTENVTILCENGEIWFQESDCKDKLCVNCGKLSKRGSTAICLPNKTVIIVEDSSIDALTY